MTDQTVEPLPDTVPLAPSATDASFWDSNTYRSGGDDWRQFLEIDSPEPEGSDLAALAAGGSVDSLREDASFVSPISELAELADVGTDQVATNAAPPAAVTGFEFLAGSSDDLLPDR